MDSRRFYCHACSQEVHIPSNVQDLACPQCHGGFIEELPTRSIRWRIAGPSQFGASSLRTFPTIETSSVGNGTTVFQQGPNVFTFQSSGPLNLDVMLRQMLENILGSDNLQMFVGNPSDYVHNQAEFDNILTQLLNRLDNTGPPPASASQLSSINKVNVTQDEVEHKAACPICFDEYTLKEEVDKLPCSHSFHHQCILDWLQRHGTCPVCRKTLDGQDTTQTNYFLSSNAAPSTGQSTSSQAESSTNSPMPSNEETTVASSSNRTQSQDNENASDATQESGAPANPSLMRHLSLD
jgi:predicted RNA-binding Zn-ribbon protein involved in translation (DUF1610 family)